MHSSSLKVRLLYLSILLTLSSTNVVAAKLTVEQRLELLENELSENKSELKKTQAELAVYKDRVTLLQGGAQGNKATVESPTTQTALSPVADNIKNENNELEVELANHCQGKRPVIIKTV